MTKCDRKVGNILYSFSTKQISWIGSFKPLILDYIVTNKIDSVFKLDTALNYLKNKKTEQLESLDIKEFELASGVGVIVSNEDIQAYVKKFVNEKKEAILDVAGKVNHPNFLAPLREGL